MNKKNIETIYSLSPAQQGMLYDTVSAPTSGIYIEQLICTLTGELDREAFIRAWQWVVNRHEILRTAFAWKTQVEPLQVVLQQVKIPIEQQDWRELSPHEQATRLEIYLEEDRHRGFKISVAPLLRLTLFQIEEATWYFVWTHHHILMDGWCRHIVMKEVLSYYQALCQGQTLQLASSRPYRDYIAWLKQQDLSKAERFWRKMLQGLKIPTALGSEGELDGFPHEQERYACEHCTLSAVTTTALQSQAAHHRLTINTLLQGTWAILLSRYSGLDDVLFGITLSGRPAELAGIETMIGLCINTLPVRVKLPPEASLWVWLEGIQEYNLELRQYEYSPPGQVHQWSEIPGSLLLYESLLVVENYPLDLSILHSSALNITFSNIRSNGAQTKYALTILVTLGTKMDIMCIYDTKRLSSASIAHVLEHIRLILEYIATLSDHKLAVLQALVPVSEIPIVKPVVKKNVTELTEPRNPIEVVLMEVWMEVLGLGQVGVHENFFELGGHSLLATQLMSRIRTVLQVELPLRTLFEAPTIAQLAERIMLKAGTDESNHFLPIVPIGRHTDLPTSFAQQRLWFLNQLAPHNASYNISRPMHIRGQLNIATLRRCLEEIIRRHEALRTTFTVVADQPVQIITSPFRLELPVIDFRHIDKKAQKDVISCLITEEAQRCFDLTRGPLIRTMVLWLDEEEFLLLLVIHHIVFDAWSEGIFTREFVSLYEAFSDGKPSPLAELPIQYADFAVWQRKWLQGEILKTHIAYWKTQLYDVPDLKLPTDYSRPPLTSFHGALLPFSLPARLSADLLLLSRTEGVTLFMLLLAAFQVLLHRYSGQEDITVGTDIANRMRTETETLIGFFVNLLVLRTDLSGDAPFRTILQRVREVVLGAYLHQELPFEKVVEALQLERSANQMPLVRALFVFQNIARPSLAIRGLTITPVQIEMSTTNFDLAVFMWEVPDGLAGGVNYRSDLFKPSTIARMMEHFKVLLHSIVAQPDAPLSALEIYPQAEKQEQQTEEALIQNTHRRKLRATKRDEISLS